MHAALMYRIISFFLLFLGAWSEFARVCTADENDKRIVVIPDVHGAYDGFRSILHDARISSNDNCDWLPQPDCGTLLVQLGDIVDRGSGALDTWRCLNHLQDTAPQGTEVIRLVGNHELWWLQGLYHDRNQIADTNAVIKEIVSSLHQRILNGKIVAAHAYPLSATTDILFVHGGLRVEMAKYLETKYSAHPTASAFASTLNTILYKDIAACDGKVPCLNHASEIYAAGPERGGRNIGGPYWTDFAVIDREQDQWVEIYDSRILQVNRKYTPWLCSSNGCRSWGILQ